MMRGFARFAVHGVCLLSLLACLTAAALWVNSSRGGVDRAAFRVGGGRYTLRSAGGRVELWRPPPKGTAEGEARAWESAGRLRNRHLEWVTVRHPDPESGRVVVRPVSVGTAPDGRPMQELSALPPDDGLRALLKALEDPDRFAAAHIQLMWRAHPSVPDLISEDRQADDSTAPVLVQGGLRAELRVEGARLQAKWDDGAAMYAHVGEPSVWIDPAQRPALLEYWHGKLDVPAGSVRYPWLVYPTALPPLLWAGAFARRAWTRRRRRRSGLCLKCGYDLRESPGRCPECGTAAALSV